MKRTVVRSRYAGMALAVGLLAWGAAQPQPAWSGNSCSLSTLKGTYLIDCAGLQAQGSELSHFAVSGLEHFHGDGTVNTVFTYSDKDNILRHIHATVTYTVNPDCSGTYTARDENGVVTHTDIYVARDGSEFGWIATDPSFVDEGVERRVSQQD
jgi:hypothetical protein